MSCALFCVTLVLCYYKLVYSGLLSDLSATHHDYQICGCFHFSGVESHSNGDNVVHSNFVVGHV